MFQSYEVEQRQVQDWYLFSKEFLAHPWRFPRRTQMPQRIDPD
jgi:hypothetical protein